MKNIGFKIGMTITAILSFLQVFGSPRMNDCTTCTITQQKAEYIEEEIDSCVIIFEREGDVKIVVKPIRQINGSNTYSCQMTSSHYNTTTSLSSEIGDIIIRSCFQLFVKKSIPTITRKKQEGYHASADPEISFYIFTNKKCIHEFFRYSLDQNEYSYEYSKCFNDLCKMITSICSDFLSESFKKKYSEIHDRI